MREDDGLSAADAVNLQLDEGADVYVITIAGVLAPGGLVAPDGTIDLTALRAVIERRTRGIPRLRRTLSGSGLVESRFDIAHHVRAIDPVDGMRGFEALCGGLATARLRRDRPLWELLVVPGASTAGVGWVFRIHHAIADGTTAARLLDQLFDPETAPDVSARANLTAPPLSEGRRHRSLLYDLLRRMPRTALIGRRGTDLTAQVCSYPLPMLITTARSLDATVNDLVLAAVGRGLRSAFTELGEQPAAVVAVSVPVLLAAGGRATNQVSAAIVRVPVREPDPATAVRTIAPASRAAIASARARRLPWFSRSRAGGRVMRWFIARQRTVGVLTTNVRGPAHARSLAGAPIERVWALPVLAGTVRLGVAVVSYAGEIAVTALWDASLGRAGTAFADGIRVVMDELTCTARIDGIA